MYKTNIQKTYLFLFLILASLEFLSQSNGRVYILDDVANTEKTVTLGGTVTLEQGTPSSGSIFIAGRIPRDGDNITGTKNAFIIDGKHITINSTETVSLPDGYREVKVINGGSLTINAGIFDLGLDKALIAEGNNSKIMIDVTIAYLGEDSSSIVAKNGGDVSLLTCELSQPDTQQYELEHDIAVLRAENENPAENNLSKINVRVGSGQMTRVGYVIAGDGAEVSVGNFYGPMSLKVFPYVQQGGKVDIYCKQLFHSAQSGNYQPMTPPPGFDSEMNGELTAYAIDPTQPYTNTGVGTIDLASRVNTFSVGQDGYAEFHTQSFIQQAGHTMQYYVPLTSLTGGIPARSTGIALDARGSAIFQGRVINLPRNNANNRTGASIRGESVRFQFGAHLKGEVRVSARDYPRHITSASTNQNEDSLQQYSEELEKQAEQCCDIVTNTQN
jgi:hypothetical protein